jgi:hypothetical protein
MVFRLLGMWHTGGKSLEMEWVVEGDEVVVENEDSQDGTIGTPLLIYTIILIENEDLAWIACSDLFV